MSAQDFARAMLDKSLGFLLKQCQVRITRDFGLSQPFFSRQSDSRIANVH